MGDKEIILQELTGLEILISMKATTPKTCFQQLKSGLQKIGVNIPSFVTVFMSFMYISVSCIVVIILEENKSAYWVV